MSHPAAQMMTEDEARKITERIRSTIVHTRESIEKIQRLLTEARDGMAHVALGYSEGEWTRYMADLFAEAPLRLPRDQRDQLVGYLAGEGMTPAAIAPIVGVTRRRVSQIRSAIEGGNDFHPDVNTETGEVSDDYPSTDVTTGGEVTPAAPAVTGQGAPAGKAPGERVEASPPLPPRRPVTGLDGKTYTRPPAAPRAAPRRPLPDQFFDAAYDMGRAVERVARLTEDDRFPQNAEKIAAKHRNDLIRSRDLLQQVINSLTKEVTA